MEEGQLTGGGGVIRSRILNFRGRDGVVMVMMSRKPEKKKLGPAYSDRPIRTTD